MAPPPNPTTMTTAQQKAGTEGTQQSVGKVQLKITHVASGSSVIFGSFLIRTFKDTLTTKYNSQEVYGRMDPISTYQGTTRKISLGIDLETLADNANASRYLAAVSQLMWFQYPVYEQAGNALSISRPPLVRVEFANYIRSGTGGPLLCALQGVSYSPFDKFDLGSSPSVVTPKGGSGQAHLLPVRISVDMDLVVLHENPVGWMDTGNKTKFIGGAKWGKVDFDGVYGQVKSKDGWMVDATAGSEGQQGRLANEADFRAAALTSNSSPAALAASLLGIPGAPDAEEEAALEQIFGTGAVGLGLE
jgi:hypothetical protein